MLFVPPLPSTSRISSTVSYSSSTLYVGTYTCTSTVFTGSASTLMAVDQSFSAHCLHFISWQVQLIEYNKTQTTKHSSWPISHCYMFLYHSDILRQSTRTDIPHTVQHSNTVLTALTGVINTLIFWNTQSWEASIYRYVILKLCDSEHPKVQAHGNLYFVCIICTDICCDVCDPKWISSKWSVWSVFTAQPDTVDFLCSICSNVFRIFVSCLLVWSVRVHSSFYVF
jgi:hypothetical protein